MFVCSCLNTRIVQNVRSKEEFPPPIVDGATLGLSFAELKNNFGAGLADVKLYKLNSLDWRVEEKLPALVRVHAVENLWRVHHCLLCDTPTFAVSKASDNKTVLVGSSMTHDEATIKKLHQSADLSMAFGVILPKKDVSLMDSSGSLRFSSRPALQIIQAQMNQYLKKEQDAMEENIRLFSDQQHAAYEAKKSQAKAHKNAILSILGDLADEDDENDSAVPLSPLSLNSNSSPGLAVSASNSNNVVRSAMGTFGAADARAFTATSTAFAAYTDSEDAGNEFRLQSNSGARPKLFPSHSVTTPVGRRASADSTLTCGSKAIRRMTTIASTGCFGDDDHEEVFNLDEQQLLTPSLDSYSGDAETDDSGTFDERHFFSGRVRRNRQSEQSISEEDATIEQPITDMFVCRAAGYGPAKPKGFNLTISSASDNVLKPLNFGTSLPVHIPLTTRPQDSTVAVAGNVNPLKFGTKKNIQRAAIDEEEFLSALKPDETDASDFSSCKGVKEVIGMDQQERDDNPELITAESFQAISRSLHPAGDLQLLFGDRPSRRRYLTGEVVRAQQIRDV